MMQQKQLRQDKARSTGIGEIEVTKNKIVGTNFRKFQSWKLVYLLKC